MSTGGKAVVLKLLGAEVRAFFRVIFALMEKITLLVISLILCLTPHYNEALILISKETIHIPFACVYETGSAQLFDISSVTIGYPSF